MPATMNPDFAFPSTSPTESASPDLEPASDGSPSSSAKTAKKARRQTAFYPNVNSSNKLNKPFSRSAAKRESVMALGSIEYLQHYFTKTGLSAKTNPLAGKKPNNNLVPALGGLQHLRTDSASLNSKPAMILPPSPAIPINTRPAFPTVIKDYETNPETLRPGVIHDLETVEHAWWLDAPSSSDFEPPADPSKLAPTSDGHTQGHGHGHIDVLTLLKTTTRAVRSVRNYLVSIPDDSHGAGPHGGALQFRPHSLSPVPAASRRLHSATRGDSSNADPLTLIRKAALDVLGSLRELEEHARVPLSDDAYDAQSDHGSTGAGAGPGTSRVASPSTNSDADLPPEQDEDQNFAISVVNVHGSSKHVAIWDDEEDPFDAEDEEQEKRDVWDERLVLGSGWLYRQDITRDELSSARMVVASYLNVVDNALFGGSHNSEKRGWLREKEKLEKIGASKLRRSGSNDSLDSSYGHGLVDVGGRASRRIVSSGLLDSMREMTVTEEPDEDDELLSATVDDEDLPLWAKRSTFNDDPLGRVHALLVALLPASLLVLLPMPDDSSAISRTALFESLTSGQLLCVAYNAGVRKSGRPWGYISKDAIHDVAALEAQLEASAEQADDETTAKVKKGWTFRRTDNLRLWAAALKLRYMLPVVTPAQPDAAASNAGTPSGTPLGSPNPSHNKFPRKMTEPPIIFDARLVARKEEGWEGILEPLLLRWMSAVVEERRLGM